MSTFLPTVAQHCDCLFDENNKYHAVQEAKPTMLAKALELNAFADLGANCSAPLPPRTPKTTASHDLQE